MRAPLHRLRRPFFLTPKFEQERSLSAKRRFVGVIPNNVIGPFNFFLERHLGIDHRFGRVAFDFHFTDEIGELDVERTSDHDHSVAQGFAAGFIEKWNVCEEKFGSLAVLFRFNAPLLTNPRMENLFEPAPLGGVLEHYRPNRLAIQVAAAQKNPEPELPKKLLLNLFKIDKLPGDGIGVEELRFGQNPAEALNESAFACGNPACDPNC